MSPVGDPPEPLHTIHERLYQAAVNGEAHKIVELIKLGAKMVPDQEGRTPLHMACANGFVDAARSLILSGGAKINQLDAVLAKAHANLYVKNKSGFTALHLAAQNGHNQSSRVLLMEGCGPDVKNNYGDTPLHTATRYGHAGVVRILVSAFCNVQETNRNGDTALHISVAMRKRKLTKILLEAGAAVHAKNEQGESALDIARRKQFPELEEMLLDPPKRALAAIETLDRDERDGKGRKREKDPNTSTSSGKPGGNNCASRRKKKTKTKNDSGGMMQRSRSLPHAIPVGPYGCPHSPHNMAGFPTPKIETLPPDPLAKGEQYYLDLAGNIRKGPVGRGYSCYCVPFFKNFEKKLEADKQELNDKIGESKQDLEKKLRTLERNTITQLQSLDLMPRDANGNHPGNEDEEGDDNEDVDHSLEAFAESKIGRRTSPLGRSSSPAPIQQGENSSIVGESRWSKLMECRASLGLKLDESSGESSGEEEGDAERRPGSLDPASVQPMPVLLHRTRPLSSSYLHLPNANLNEVGLPPPSSVDVSARTLSRLDRRPMLSSFGTREPATAGRSPSLLENSGTPLPSIIGMNISSDDPGVKKPFCRPPRPPSYQTHMERVFRPGQPTTQPLPTTFSSQPRPASTSPKGPASTQTTSPSQDTVVSPHSAIYNGVSMPSYGTVPSTLVHKQFVEDLSNPTEIRTSMQNLTAYVPSGLPQHRFSYTGNPVTPNPSLNLSSQSSTNLDASSQTLSGNNVANDKTPENHSVVSSPRTQRYIMSSEV
ncbi:uncharacterized protein LOC111248369 isoform X2 [Varroa destructor]|uniref:Alpha-latrotoxin n=1 Tax=Varroa destructor TaxID=109461 RepID=A0A7M7MEL6_VARDE|nr:uncharacterized protein LOC111248369 isoform X2 [Varroa destructor]